jgi:hypothetical protein
MALDANAENIAQVNRLFIREAELFSELMDPDLSCHVRGEPFVEPQPSERTLQCDTFGGVTPNTTCKSAVACGLIEHRSARSNPFFRKASVKHDGE